MLSKTCYSPRHLLALITLSLSGVGAIAVPLAAQAETTLSRAVVQDLRNQVELRLQNQRPRPARKADTMTPGDALATARRSLAELRFNDRSLARVGELALFYFQPGTRNFRLNNGTMLLLIPPGRGQTRVRTPNAAAGIRGSALFVRYNPKTNTTLIGALTNSQIEVSNQSQAQRQVLKAGQMAVVVQDQIQQIYNFDLNRFYQTSDLVRGLDLSRSQTRTSEDPAIAAVQEETAQALQSQAPLTGQEVVENPAFIALTGNGPTLPSASVASDGAPGVSIENGSRPDYRDTPAQIQTTSTYELQTDSEAVSRDLQQTRPQSATPAPPSSPVVQQPSTPPAPTPPPVVQQPSTPPPAPSPPVVQPPPVPAPSTPPIPPQPPVTPQPTDNLPPTPAPPPVVQQPSTPPPAPTPPPVVQQPSTPPPAPSPPVVVPPPVPAPSTPPITPQPPVTPQPTDNLPPTPAPTSPPVVQQPPTPPPSPPVVEPPPVPAPSTPPIPPQPPVTPQPTDNLPPTPAPPPVVQQPSTPPPAPSPPVVQPPSTPTPSPAPPVVQQPSTPPPAPPAPPVVQPSPLPSPVTPQPTDNLPLTPAIQSPSPAPSNPSGPPGLTGQTPANGFLPPGLSGNNPGLGQNNP